MPSDIDLDQPISHAIADGWADFAETVLPAIAGTDHAEAHVAFHLGAMYVLQIAQQGICGSSGGGVAGFGYVGGRARQLHNGSLHYKSIGKRALAAFSPTIAPSVASQCLDDHDKSAYLSRVWVLFRGNYADGCLHLLSSMCRLWNDIAPQAR
jgi:hypothetical protein